MQSSHCDHQLCGQHAAGTLHTCTTMPPIVLHWVAATKPPENPSQLTGGTTGCWVLQRSTDWESTFVGWQRGKPSEARQSNPLAQTLALLGKQILMQLQSTEARAAAHCTQPGQQGMGQTRLLSTQRSLQTANLVIYRPVTAATKPSRMYISHKLTTPGQSTPLLAGVQCCS